VIHVHCITSLEGGQYIFVKELISMDKDLVVIQNNQAVTSSRKVAEKFEKEHRHVLRDIDSLKEDVPNFGQMFYEDEIPDSYGRPQRAYYINKKGFQLLAMGFTGSKAIKWKLEYIDTFEAMDKMLQEQKKPLNQWDMIIELATAQKTNEARLQAVESNVSTIKEVFKARSPEDEWRDEVKHLIDLIVNSMGEGNTSEKYKMVVTTSYERLSSRANVNLNARLRNARKNYREIHNASESEAKAKVTKVQVIQKDKKIADIYLTILKEMAIQYGVVV
jgi:Rha family phage regulatory protein